jgi:hypothetical protein
MDFGIVKKLNQRKIKPEFGVRRLDAALLGGPTQGHRLQFNPST